MTTLNLTTRLVTVPRHRDSLTHAIEKSGLDYVSAVVTCYEKGTGLTDDYEITGIPGPNDDYEITGTPRVDDDGRCPACSQTAARCGSWGKPCCPVCVHEPADTMTLTIMLTTDQYVLLMRTLRQAQTDRTRTSVHSLELEWLRTTFAVAAAPDPKDTT